MPFLMLELENTTKNRFHFFANKTFLKNKPVFLRILKLYLKQRYLRRETEDGS